MTVEECQAKIQQHRMSSSYHGLSEKVALTRSLAAEVEERSDGVDDDAEGVASASIASTDGGNAEGSDIARTLAVMNEAINATEALAAMASTLSEHANEVVKALRVARMRASEVD